MSFVGVVLAILGIIVLSAIPVGYLILRKLKENQISDTFVINDFQELARNMGIGWLQQIEKGKNGRVHIHYFSFVSGNLKRVKEIASPHQIIFQPKGGFDNGVNVLRILPKDPIAYAQSLFNQIEEGGVAAHIIRAQRTGLNRAAQHLNEMGDGEISEMRFGMEMDKKDELMRSQHRDQDKRGMNRYQEP